MRPFNLSSFCKRFCLAALCNLSIFFFFFFFGLWFLLSDAALVLYNFHMWLQGFKGVVSGCDTVSLL